MLYIQLNKHCVQVHISRTKGSDKNEKKSQKCEIKRFSHLEKNCTKHSTAINIFFLFNLTFFHALCRSAFLTIENNMEPIKKCFINELLLPSIFLLFISPQFMNSVDKFMFKSFYRFLHSCKKTQKMH